MRSLISKSGWMLAGVLALYVLSALAGAVTGGPLDPPGAPSPTMKTLGDIAPSWHRILDSSDGDVNDCNSTRFTCVFGGQAVLDNETGLVWERSPIWNGTDVWSNAQTVCTSDPTGGRYGWRLPSAAELLSLKDANTLDLVADSPFTGVAGHAFWSATSPPGDDAKARYFTFFQFSSNEQAALKTDGLTAGIWCVRGGRSGDPPTANDLNGYSKVLSAQGNDPCSSERFTCVLGGDAVLDHQTGLVWMRNMGQMWRDLWGYAVDACYRVDLGGLRGWRMPSASELMGIMDPGPYDPAVPPGSPFIVPLSYASLSWWTSTEVPGSTTDAYAVRFKGQFQQPPGLVGQSKSGVEWSICVRGVGTP